LTAAAAGFNETAKGHTWGLDMTFAFDSKLSGRGVKVAILDTGLDLSHPDFEGRSITDLSFVTGPAGSLLSTQDNVGHGTHCTGTSCGPRTVDGSIGYGIAYEAEIFIGKVLNDQGRGLDGDILAGINWAIRQGCRVISISIEGPPSQSFIAYERVAKAGLRKTAIIAAAGNESNRRQGHIAPVGTPANCPSIMAVAAVDANGQVSDFSNAGRSTNSGGGTGGGARSASPAPGWTFTPPGRCLQGTSGSAGRAWPPLTWRGLRR
jgi:subtilisin family serine protease